MHLKSLTLKGFKSFASATTLVFEPGICAVVGPNGSGKSNVVDALSWVMGEQGAKSLRGGKMEDVIFAGAGDRRPLGRAEVTLTIDNSDQALPIEFSEVSITRRMFRDGGGEYEINGQRVRLMDVQELLSDSGIGREMHVIVGQGRLSQILESRPEDRRAFIEEAAGVLKHRRRKEKAQRKLTGMQANLDRLTDLTQELGKQLKPLARQAEAARRAASVQAQVRESRRLLGSFELTSLMHTYEEAKHQADALEEQATTLEAESEQRNEALAAAEATLTQLEPEVERAQRHWYELSALAERVSATKRVATERAAAFRPSEYPGEDPARLEEAAQRADEAQASAEEAVEIAQDRLDSIMEEVGLRQEAADAASEEHLAQVRALADRRAGVVRLLAAQDSARAQLDTARTNAERAAEDANEARQRVAAVHEELEAVPLPADLAEFEQAHREASQEAKGAEQRLEELRSQRGALERRIAGLRSRIETLSTEVRAPIDGEVTALAEALTSDVPAAVSAALGGFVTAVVGEAEAVDWSAVARTGIFTPAEGDHEAWRMSAQPSRGVWLLDRIDAAAEIAPAINRLLADVVLVEGIEEAQQVVADDPRLRAVTTEGELFGEGWQVRGHGQRTAVDAAALVSQSQASLDAATTELEELAGTFEGARQSAEDARVNAAGATAALREQRQAHDQGQAQRARLERQREQAAASSAKADARRAEEEASVETLEAQLAELADRLSRVEEVEDDPSTAQRDQAVAALGQVKSMEMEARLHLRTAETELERVRGRGESLRRQAAHEREAAKRHERAMAAQRRRSEVAAEVGRLTEDLGERVTQALERAAGRRTQHSQQLQAQRVQVAQAKDAAKTVRVQLEQAKHRSHEAEMRASQAEVRLGEAQTRLEEQLGCAWSELVDAVPEGFDADAERTTLRQAERDLRALGKVNPLALEEYKALEERYQFLSTQLADVERARRDLRDVIEEVDAKILQLFTEAWRDVEAEFPKVFATLFPGGHARLLLTEPEDMLATGIEVEASPPGKRVKRLSLLSGGEKSLTALAMLVAIFRARPSPFYVMDEVEAALDDVNLRRLIALFEELREDSQLIVITHQKPTMDVANVLYGVTMRGDGVTRVISQRMSREPAVRG